MPDSAALHKLKILKERVLDLTSRNAMINSRFNSRSKKFFRIIDEIPQQIYEKLSSTTMSFKSLPPLSEDPKDEEKPEFQEKLAVAIYSDQEYISESENASDEEEKKLLRKLKDKVREELGWEPFNGKNTSLEDHASDNGLDPRYDLKDSSENDETKHSDTFIQTLFLDEQLNATIQKIWRDFRSSQKERGVNPLYFCFGFLKWKQSNDSDDDFNSPLLMLQVQLEEVTRGTKLKVSATGDDLILNQSLKEKLKKDFKIDLPELPELGEDESFHNLSNFFTEVERLAESRNWSLKRWVSFGIYDATHMPIYKDLQDIEKLGPEKFGLLTNLLEGSDQEVDQGNFAEIYEVDSKKSQKLIPALVTDADSSQFSAVMDAIKGENIVLKGPPGTGKSQTITNIISSLSDQGKKVLFVAQKQAALDVVRNNLEAIGAEDYLLEIFSVKANKKAVMDSIRKRYEKYDSGWFNLPRLDDLVKDLNKVKKDLNNYSEFINQDYEETDKSIHDILWDQIEFDSLGIPQFDVTIQSPETFTDSLLRADCNELEILRDIINDQLREINVNKSPLRLLKKTIIASEDIEQAKINILEKAQNFLSSYDEVQKFREDNQELPDPDISQVLKNESINNWLESDADSDIARIIKLLLKLNKLSDMKNFLDIKTKYDRRLTNHDFAQKLIKDKFDYDPELSLYSMDEIKEASKQLQNRGFLFFFNSNWWNAKNIFSSLKAPTNKDKTSSKEAGALLEKLYTFHNTKSSTERDISGMRETLVDQLAVFTKFSESITEDLLYKNKSLIEKISADLKVFSKDLYNFWVNNPESFRSYNSLLAQFSLTYHELTNVLSELEFEYPLSEKLPPFLNSKLKDFKDLISNLFNDLDYLKDFMYLKTSEKNNLQKKELLEFYENFTKSGADINRISEAYKHFVRKAQKTHIERNSGRKIGNYVGSRIESLRSQLSDLDKKASSRYQEELGKSLYKQGHQAPPGRSSGRVSEKTELGLIKHLTNVSSPKMSIREFIKNSQNALLCHKPCTLMSPLSVSSSLPLKEIFDVVIIDEASQMKPEFALGAIARAKQAIIVGDPKQLPPTDFFQNRIADDEFDDDLSDESILDMALTVFHPPRELLWHYRSRHEDLIKFSNTKFYQNNLLVPVTADKSRKDRGISYNYIEDGLYSPSAGGGSGGINVNEAIAVVEAAISFMKERPDESLGIATMNLSQKDFIQREFDLRSYGDEAVANYLSRWEEDKEGLEEFFVKNLENVQGDERDVIILSTLYGRTAASDIVRQNFGPINKAFGPRRLNVLFTRAKNQIQLFTSLKTSDINVDENSKEGVKVFKDYLTFAETGILEDVEENVNEVESPFQQWAIDVINSLPGYKAIHEIGSQGYRIDIGVKHEDFPYGFVMAVETDGATYHSSKSARDRDLLRQSILEDHGWVFHRIWSTDWIQNPVRVKEKLVSALDDRLNTLLTNLERQHGS